MNFGPWKATARNPCRAAMQNASGPTMLTRPSGLLLVDVLRLRCDVRGAQGDGHHVQIKTVVLEEVRRRTPVDVRGDGQIDDDDRHLVYVLVLGHGDRERRRPARADR